MDKNSEKDLYYDILNLIGAYDRTVDDALRTVAGWYSIPVEQARKIFEDWNGARS